jgi:hypothetical protein
MVDVTVEEVHDFPHNFFLVYRLSTHHPEDGLPIGHAFPKVALADRAVAHGYDFDDPDFHRKVTDHLIREGLSWHPEVEGVHPHGHPLVGQVHDYDAAEATVKVVWKPEHIKKLKAGHPITHDDPAHSGVHRDRARIAARLPHHLAVKAGPDAV